MSVQKYWPGDMSWDEISKRVQSWSTGGITRDEAYEVMQVAGLLGIFGHPDGSQFREERQVSDATICLECKGLKGFERSDLPKFREAGVIRETESGPVFRMRSVEFRLCFGHPETAKPRDFQFSGFAHALMKKLDELIGEVTQWGVENDIEDQAQIAQRLYAGQQKIIANSAYDLVKHTIACIDIANLDRLTNVECVERTPDLIELPEEPR